MYCWEALSDETLAKLKMEIWELLWTPTLIKHYWKWATNKPKLGNWQKKILSEEEISKPYLLQNIQQAIGFWDGKCDTSNAPWNLSIYLASNKH